VNDGYVIRRMQREELDLVVEWAAAEGWNPGLHDAEAFYATDPSGFFVGLLDGELIASISAVRYGPGFIFVGYYIVRPAHRGKGYGLRLWTHAMERLGDTLSGLDAVLAQAANYARSGFEVAYHNHRYQGLATSPAASDHRIAPCEASDIDAVIAYDRAMFPEARRTFIEHWARQPDSHTLLLKDGGTVTGYGTVRPSQDGYRIGPLFADDARRAESLFDALVGRVPEAAPVCIDVPQPNAPALDIVRRRHMTPMFETARMYRGGTPDIDVQRIFGVTSLELG
jgi:GNAT superfamily N-acetyltransferase